MTASLLCHFGATPTLKFLMHTKYTTPTAMKREASGGEVGFTSFGTPGFPAAAYLGGKLPGFKVGGSWRFKREDVLKWIEDQKKNNNQ